MKLSNVIRSAFTADLLWRKERKAPLYGVSETLVIKEKYKDVIRDVCNAGYRRTISQERNLLNISELIREHFKPIVAILELFPKNLFLCGGSVLTTIFREEYDHQITCHDFDIFFCCKNVDEAEYILEECLNLLIQRHESIFPKIDPRYVPSFKFSQGCVTIECERVKIQFIRRIYKEPSQILLGFDIWACQHGWNPEIGYFTIPTGALSLAINAFPIDTTKRSFSFSNRLFKYYRVKQFDILLPGVDTSKSDNIITPDGTFIVKCANGIVNLGESVYLGNKQGACLLGCIATNYRIYSDDFESKWPGLRQDYEADYKYNGRLIELGMLSLVTFKTSSPRKIFYMTQNNISRACKYRFEITRNFSKIYRITNAEKELFSILSDKNKRWKTDNPGSQGFGTFNPIDTSPRKWYGYDRPAYYIGIHPDNFIAIYECWVKSNVWQGVPRDIFRFICKWIMIVEGNF